MKKLIFRGSTVIIAILFIAIQLKSSVGNAANISQHGPDVDEKLELPAGAEARASDGTYITAAPTNRIIYICPGWGRSCRGSATIDNLSITYSSSKGFNKPDILIMD